MGWFFLGLLMAIGGIWAAYKRSKRTPMRNNDGSKPKARDPDETRP